MNTASKLATIAAAAALTAACATKSQPPETDPNETDVQAETPAPKADVDYEALTQELCSEPGCSLHSVSPAGKSQAGHTMTVVEFAIPNKPEDADEMFACNPNRRQIWRVIEAPAGPEFLMLLDLCNDGYGAAMLGEDTLTIDDNFLSHERFGGSSSRWFTSRTFKLDPLTVLGETSGGHHIFFGTCQQTTRDYETGQTDFWWHAQPCDPSGEPEEPDWETLPCDDSSAVYRYSAIPQLPEGFGPIDAATTALGSCGLEVNSSGAGGYVIHGEPGAADDARMKVLMEGPSTLVIEVMDDNWVHMSDSWLYEDHIELWLGADNLGVECTSGKGKPIQWAVTLGDGEVYIGRGKPKGKLGVVKQEFSDNGVRAKRLVLTLPNPVEALTVVYSDSDDGQTQERLIATSNFKFADERTMGATLPWRVDEGGHCEAGSTLKWVSDAVAVPEAMGDAFPILEPEY